MLKQHKNDRTYVCRKTYGKINGSSYRSCVNVQKQERKKKHSLNTHCPWIILWGKTNWSNCRCWTYKIVYSKVFLNTKKMYFSIQMLMSKKQFGIQSYFLVYCQSFFCMFYCVVSKKHSCVLTA